MYFLCCDGYWLCAHTIPRWRRYAAFHGYDHVVLRDVNVSRDDIFWRKWDAASVLLSLGYTWVMGIDSDTVPIRWEHTVESWTDIGASDLGHCRFPASHSEFGAGSATELVASRDRGHFGFFGPPVGPFNVGVVLLKNSNVTRHLLQWQVLRKKYRKRGGTIDQDSFNAWYFSDARWRQSVTVLRWCFGSRPFMCNIDPDTQNLGQVLNTSTTVPRPWAAPLARLYAMNSWVLHTLGLGAFLSDGTPEIIAARKRMLAALYADVDRTLPIPELGEAPPAEVPWRCSTVAAARAVRQARNGSNVCCAKAL